MRTKTVELLFSALTILTALACNKSSAESGVVETATGTKPSLAVVADDHGFTPTSLDVPADRDVSITFTRTTDDTCAKEVVFPELKMNVPLPLNKPVTVTVPNGPARTLTFQCGMGMFKGKVVVK